MMVGISYYYFFDCELVSESKVLVKTEEAWKFLRVSGIEREFIECLAKDPEIDLLAVL